MSTEESAELASNQVYTDIHTFTRTEYRLLQNCDLRHIPTRKRNGGEHAN